MIKVKVQTQQNFLGTGFFIEVVATGSQAVSFASEFGALKSTEVRHRNRQNEADDKQHDCEFG